MKGDDDERCARMAEWLSFSTEIGGMTAYVTADVEPAEQATHPEAPVQHRIDISGYATDADGYPDDEVADRINAFEDALSERCNVVKAVFVASVTTPSATTLLVYAPTAIAQLLPANVGLSANVETSTDASWSEYHRLIPQGEALDAVRDVNQLQELEEAGDDLSLPHNLTLEFSFANESDAEKALTALIDTTTYDVMLTFSDDQGEGVEATTVTQLSIETINEHRQALLTIVSPFGGKFVYWGAEPLE